jgi:hypothetical protein
MAAENRLLPPNERPIKIAAEKHAIQLGSLAEEGGVEKDRVIVAEEIQRLAVPIPGVPQNEPVNQNQTRYVGAR